MVVSTKKTRAGTRGRRAAILLLLLVGLYYRAESAPKIRVSGKWLENLKATDITGGPGTDFKADFESAADAVDITISKTSTPTSEWKIEVKRIDTNWDPSLVIWVMRTSDHGDLVSGGTGYQEVTDEYVDFIQGTGGISKIELQFRLDGVSAGVITADDYSTDLYYMVTEL